MARPKGPLIALIAIVTIAVSLTLQQLLTHRVTVTAADGSEVVIETRPSELEARAAAGDPETMRKYGVSPHEEMQLPEGTGREANLSGTKVR